MTAIKSMNHTNNVILFKNQIFVFFLNKKHVKLNWFYVHRCSTVVAFINFTQTNFSLDNSNEIRIKYSFIGQYT